MSLQCRWGGPWAFLSRGTDSRGQQKKKIAEERSLKETRLVSVASWLIQSAWLITAGDSPLAEGDSRLCKHHGQCPEIKEPKCSHRKGAGNGAWTGKLNALLNQQRHPTTPSLQGRMGGRGRRCHCTSPKQPALEEKTRITGAAVVLNYQCRGSLARMVRTFKGTWWECHQLPERTTKTE